MRWPSRDGKLWTPWKVQGLGLWNRGLPKSPACDPVTCAECPGGERCCNYAPPSHPSDEATYVSYDDDGYPARRRR